MAPKRKRAASAAAKDAAANETTIQHSSRDASGEDTHDSTLEDVKERKAMDPPAKRTRASSSQKNGQVAIQTGGKVEMPVNGAIEGTGEHGEAGKMRMDAPPKAGSVDPIGYKTNPPPQGRPVRVYADGVFDMFHLGHMRVLQQAKTAFPDTHLIVGVTGDTETHKRKGLTVMSGAERAESLRHCRWVDEVVEDCPWIINVAFLEQHQIDYVAHDDLPYGASEGDDIYAPIKQRGMFLVTQRTEGVSTTGIITKIVRDYEQYIARQLKRGTSRQELNVSWFKKNELDIKRHVGELRDNIRQNWMTTGQELSKEFKQFWAPNSRPGSPAATAARTNNGTAAGAKSPLSGNAQSSSGSVRSSTPSKGRGNTDFAAGYAMGLIGGVKGWMEGSKRKNLADSRPHSPPSDSESPGEESSSRGRKGKALVEEAVDDIPHS